MENKRPIYFYVANLGSEVQRIFSWKEKGDKEAMQNAFKRSVEIIKSIKDFGNESATLEMEILENSLMDLVSREQKLSINRDEASVYFNPFALRVVNNL